MHSVPVNFLLLLFQMQIEICRKLCRSGSKQDDEDDEDSPVTVGHNIYILAHQVREGGRERKKGGGEKERDTHRHEERDTEREKKGENKD